MRWFFGKCKEIWRTGECGRLKRQWEAAMPSGCPADEGGWVFEFG